MKRSFYLFPLLFVSCAWSVGLNLGSSSGGSGGSSLTTFSGVFVSTPGSRNALTTSLTTTSGITGVQIGDICTLQAANWDGNVNDESMSVVSRGVPVNGSIKIGWVNPQASPDTPGYVVIDYFCVRP